MTKQELFEGFWHILAPIIEADEDIIDYREGSELSDEEYKTLLIWLVNATIFVMLNNHTGEVEKQLVEDCKHDMNVAESKFEEAGFENVNKMLFEIFEQNYKEWKELVIRKFEGAKEEFGKDENVTDNQENSPEASYIQFYTSFLGEIILKEDDFLEFLDKYSNVDRNALIAFMAFNVFYTHLMQAKTGKINPPKEDPIVKYLEGMLEIATSNLQNIVESFIKGNVENLDEFQNDVHEILGDHFNEFIKKMYKRIYKKIQESK